MTTGGGAADMVIEWAIRLPLLALGVFRCGAEVRTRSGEADMPRASGAGQSDENDPRWTKAANIAVLHNDRPGVVS